MVSTDPRTERTAIDREVENMTVLDVLARHAAERGNQPALSWRDDGKWKTLSWRDYREAVRALAAGLVELGVTKGEIVLIMARNRPEHLIADLGILHAGAVPATLYNTLSPDQIAYIANHSEARVAIVEGRDFMERFEKIKPELPHLEHVVLIDDAPDYAHLGWTRSWEALRDRGAELVHEHTADIDARASSLRPEDPATIIYTSGTTGEPKGVVITHHNALWTSASVARIIEWPPGWRYLSYLPLAHSLERLAGHYLTMWTQGCIFFCPNILEVFEYVPEVRPYIFVAVPRLYEKLEAGIVAKVGEEPNERKRKIARRALEIAPEIARRRRSGEGVPLRLRAQHEVFSKLVYSKIIRSLGLEGCRLALTGAAPMSVDVIDFFVGMGLPLLEGYGLSESTAPATLNLPEAAKPGTVGPPLAGVEVRLADDGELLIRGGNVAPGYFRDPDGTAQTFDREGWLHSGDIAQIDGDGFVTIVDRKKELIITSGGKNVAPTAVEGLLKRHPLISQACAVGDGKPFVGALIVLDGDVAPSWARDNGIAFSDLASFSREEAVQREVDAAVRKANERLSRVEQVKRFKILDREWTPDGNELTATLKLKRRVIYDKYATAIDELYSQQP